MLSPTPDRMMSADIMRMWRADMATMPLPTDDAARVDLLRATEELKAAAAALQARVTVDFAASQRAEQAAAGVDQRDVGRGVAAQIGLARRESPARGARDLGLARALVEELPHTLEALAFGTTTEWRATIIARETALLSREDRATVDAELAGRPGGLAALGDRATESAARCIAHRLDPYAATKRARKAEGDRRVSLRPAPDTMSLVTGLLPVRQGVAVFASLTARADSLRATGDTRSRGQIMADTFVERLTGQATADAVPVEVHLVMTDQSLVHPEDSSDAAASRQHRRTSAGPFGPHADAHQDGAALVSEGPTRRPAAHTAAVSGQQPRAPRAHDDADPAGSDAGPARRRPTESARTAPPTRRVPIAAELREAPAWLTGYGPVPAPLARSWLRETQADVWLRRLYTSPTTGMLAAMDSRRRTFTGPVRELVIARDRVCRTPWCDAPIRHVDHIVRHADGGPTSSDNGQSLCAACNLAREAPGWTTTGSSDEVTTRTPTGHESCSSPPVPAAPPSPAFMQTRGEFYFRDLALIA